MNALTERLLAEGYTKDNHPDYVAWSSWRDFEYTHVYLCTTVWETPCGLLKKGGFSYNHSSYMGVDYCPENDNPLFGCPYYDEKPCPYRRNTQLWGANCVYHQAHREYDYEQSVEKLWDEWDRVQHQAWIEATQGGIFCSCMEWDRPSREYVSRYNIDRCISIQCKNEVCAVTKRPRNLERVNIFYDIARVKRYKKGLITTTDRQIEKGVKVFDLSVARTDAEIWLKHNQDNFRPRKSSQDRSDEHFSEYHGTNGFGNYDFFEFSITPQNIRIERRETRDLLQDLRDVQEGIEVIHASDKLKAAARQKKERKEKRAEQKAERSKRKVIQNFLRIAREGLTADGEPATPVMIDWAKKNLTQRGVAWEEQESAEPENPQTTLW